MKCYKCGADVPGGRMSCGSCGAMIFSNIEERKDVSDTQVKSPKGVRRGRIVMVIVGLLCVILAFSTISLYVSYNNTAERRIEKAWDDMFK